MTKLFRYRGLACGGGTYRHYLPLFMAESKGHSEDVGVADKTVPWYHGKPEEFSPAARELFERYSNIPADRVDANVFDLVVPS